MKHRKGLDLRYSVPDMGTGIFFSVLRGNFSLTLHSSPNYKELNPSIISPSSEQDIVPPAE
jgi:hypothetical protein